MLRKGRKKLLGFSLPFRFLKHCVLSCLLDLLSQIAKMSWTNYS
jgi:hypothetical protein